MDFFNSFFIAGFECADHLNGSGQRVNLLKETAHDTRLEEDYILIKNLGIHTIREGICWSEVEKTPYQYDFSEVHKRLQKAEELGIQQIWDLMHFGCPEDIYPTHPQFERRFVSLCQAFIDFYQSHSEQQLFLVPINEISFHSWFAGESRGTAPYVRYAGWDVKYALCKAAISGIKTIKIACPEAIISLVEPLVHIHPDLDSCPMEIEKQNNYQFQAMDILTGRICPELGGNENLVDLLGINYYWNCQWRPKGGTIPWPDEYNERIPFDKLILQLHEKYQLPLWISETGHIGVGRAQWLEEITAAVISCQNQGITIHGLCLYPVIDRPDWDKLDHYHNSGIWDLDQNKNRIPCMDLVDAIFKSQEILEKSIFNTNKNNVNRNLSKQYLR